MHDQYIFCICTKPRFVFRLPFDTDWTQVESVGSPEDSHRAYGEFLTQFPLCFGYWIKVSTRT